MNDSECFDRPPFNIGHHNDAEASEFDRQNLPYSLQFSAVTILLSPKDVPRPTHVDDNNNHCTLYLSQKKVRGFNSRYDHHPWSQVQHNGIPSRKTQCKRVHVHVLRRNPSWRGVAIIRVGNQMRNSRYSVGIRQQRVLEGSQ